MTCDSKQKFSSPKNFFFFNFLTKNIFNPLTSDILLDVVQYKEIKIFRAGLLLKEPFLAIIWTCFFAS